MLFSLNIPNGLCLSLCNSWDCSGPKCGCIIFCGSLKFCLCNYARKAFSFCYLWSPLSQCCKYHNDEYTTKRQKGAGGTEEEKRTRTESVSFRIERTTLDDLREESRLKDEKITGKKSR
jgi:hypothetical protein